MSGAENSREFWQRPTKPTELEGGALLTPGEASLLWMDWLCLLCTDDVSDTSEWGRCAVPYIDRMMRRLAEVEQGGAWESEGL